MNGCVRLLIFVRFCRIIWLLVISWLWFRKCCVIVVIVCSCLWLVFSGWFVVCVVCWFVLVSCIVWFLRGFGWNFISCISWLVSVVCIVLWCVMNWLSIFLVWVLSRFIWYCCCLVVCVVIRCVRIILYGLLRCLNFGVSCCWYRVWCCLVCCLLLCCRLMVCCVIVCCIWRFNWLMFWVLIFSCWLSWFVNICCSLRLNVWKYVCCWLKEWFWICCNIFFWFGVILLNVFFSVFRVRVSWFCVLVWVFCIIFLLGVVCLMRFCRFRKCLRCFVLRLMFRMFGLVFLMYRRLLIGSLVCCWRKLSIVCISCFVVCNLGICRFMYRLMLLRIIWFMFCLLLIIVLVVIVWVGWRRCLFNCRWVNWLVCRIF